MDVVVEEVFVVKSWVDVLVVEVFVVGSAI